MNPSFASRPRLRCVLLTCLLTCILPTRRSHAQAGSLDVSFNPRIPYAGKILTVVVQPNGKIIVSGHIPLNPNNTQDYSSYVTRFNADGGPDATFSANVVTDNGIYAVSVQGDGKVKTIIGPSPGAASYTVDGPAKVKVKITD